MKVDNFSVYLPEIIHHFHHRAETFSAGALRYRLSAWQQITSDLDVLTTVSGLQLDFLDDIATVKPVSVTNNFHQKRKPLYPMRLQNSFISVL